MAASSSAAASSIEEPDLGGPSVSAGSFPGGMEGDVGAMGLGQRLNAAEDLISAKFDETGSSYEAREQRREWLMNMPTESGDKVLRVLLPSISGCCSQDALELRLRYLVTKRWACLWHAMQVELRVIGEEMPAVDGMRKWYEQKHAQLEVARCENKKQLDVSCNPQAAWLAGTPELVAGACNVPRSELYPDGRYGTPAPEPKRSHREGENKDKFQGPYRAPGDGFLEMQKQAMEEPRVLAGFSHTDDLPKLSGGLGVGNYAWATLARRVDIDRLNRACRSSNLFKAVTPYGGKKNDDIYKENTWQHMNVYKLKAELRSQPGVIWEIGVTDCKSRLAFNQTGARLYIEQLGKAKSAGGNIGEALCAVCSLLPESDFDRNSGLKITLDGEKSKPYGGLTYEGKHTLLSELLCLELAVSELRADTRSNHFYFSIPS